MRLFSAIPSMLAVVACVGLVGCTDDEEPENTLPSGCDAFVVTSDDDQTALQTALIEAAPGSTVCLGTGTFHLNTELSIDVEGLTLTGFAPGVSILDFSAQDTGSNGISIRSDNVTIANLDVIETAGDGVRADSVRNVFFSRVSVIWSTPSSLGNGAYGLYPVNSLGVTIDGCTVTGARDAGIYVGQSSNIIVRNSEAYGNVAGIEIENSTDAEVYGNYAHDNTGGILIFNLPELPVKDGKRANIHDNIVEYNNTPNFADKSAVVSKVPTGLGIMILASDDNEVHMNEVRGNDAIGVLVVNYTNVLFGPFTDAEYDIFPQGNFIHDNLFEGNGQNPPGLVSAAISAAPVPDIAWDGCTDPMAADDGRLVNCLSNNTSADTEDGVATYINFDLCGQAGEKSTDAGPVTCTYDSLPTADGE